jgi:mono/diheme cytochrome c family protein
MSPLLRTLALSPVGLVACGDDPAATPDVPDDAPVWYPEVQTLVVRSCGGCHTDGGDAPFALDTYEVAGKLADAMLASVEEGSMPPWHADPACQSFAGERIFTDAQEATLRAWARAGAPEGDPRDAATIEPPPRVRFTPTITGSVGGYTPPAVDLDDWRCFIFPEIQFDEETWLIGSEVEPGSPAVHHALVYALPAEYAAAAQEADDAEPGPGYTCLGALLPGMSPAMGPGLPDIGGYPSQIGVWVPGLEPELLTDGTARRVAPGSVVIAQVHYNMLYVDPEEDLTEIRLLHSDTPPARLRVTSELNYADLDIPAGQSPVSFTRRVPYHAARPLELVGFLGHAHMLASAMDLRAVASDAQETCLVDIPRWDFHWQQRYGKPSGEAIVVPSGSALELTCTYDNSPENQPIVDGVRQAPRDVGWGESSLDEMCLLYLERLEDYAPLPATPQAACAASDGCLAACEGSATACLLGCEEASYACVACVVNAAPACAPTCVAPLAAAFACVEGCVFSKIMLGGNFGACMAAECGATYDEFAACLDGQLADGGACVEPFAACGVSL